MPAQYLYRVQLIFNTKFLTKTDQIKDIIFKMFNFLIRFNVSPFQPCCVKNLMIRHECRLYLKISAIYSNIMKSHN